ncbi:hypothetical protein AB1Y20_010376 [Prymnesium parvum]|uniref:Uncharacterized protein n=1 Tax=Prymnesium parvum TaxID=97485 RepID=A0AB34IQX4_PRYPA
MGGWSCVVTVSIGVFGVEVDALKAQLLAHTQALHEALCPDVVRDALEVYARANEALQRMLNRRRERRSSSSSGSGAAAARRWRRAAQSSNSSPSSATL